MATIQAEHKGDVNKMECARFVRDVTDEKLSEEGSPSTLIVSSSADFQTTLHYNCPFVVQDCVGHLLLIADGVCDDLH